MKLTDLLLKPGGKGLIVGRNGSGKSNLLMWLLWLTPGRLGVIDPKETVTLPGVPVYYNIAKLKFDNPERFIWRPGAERLFKMEYYQEVIRWYYNQKGHKTLALDDFGGVFTNTRFPEALLVALMMGRSYKGNKSKLTVYMCIQRPVGVPRQCISEAWKLYLFYLIDKRDVQTLQEYAPGYIPADVRPDVDGKGDIIPNSRAYRFWFCVPDGDLYVVKRLDADFYTKFRPNG